MGEVIDAKVRTITVIVNKKPVTFPNEPGRDEATGGQIKAAAIAQGVNIQADFVLYIVRGQSLDDVDDAESVPLHNNLEFRAVAPDDNS